MSKSNLLLAYVGAFVIGVFAFIMNMLYPGTVNGEFALRLSIASFALSFATLVLFRLRLKKSDFESLHLGAIKIASHQWLYSVIPMTPVIALMVSNSDLISPLEMIQFMSLAWIASLFFSVILPGLLDFTGKSVLLFSGFTAVNYIVFSMGSLSSIFSWTEVGYFPIQAAILFGVFIVIFAVSKLGTKGFAISTSAFVIFSTVFALPNSNPQSIDTGAETRDFLIDENTSPSPSVVFLVYESYPAPETLALYGHNPDLHVSELQDLGFDVYDGVWSLGSNSLDSISRVFSSENSYSGDSRAIVSGEGDWLSTLDSLGYRHSAILSSDYFFRGEVSQWSDSYPEIASLRPELTKSLLGGEFDFTHSYTSPPYEEFLAKKRSKLRDMESSGEFLYSHNKLPGHSQNSGECRPNETELYLDALVEADAEMIQDVESLGDQLKDSIVFIFGDHGPYLTQNCTTIDGLDASTIGRTDIQDRISTLFAVRWPENISFEPQIEITQDIFPAVFSLLEHDLGLYERLRWKKNVDPRVFGEVKIINGVVRGGIDDGRFLFENKGLIPED